MDQSIDQSIHSGIESTVDADHDNGPTPTRASATTATVLGEWVSPGISTRKRILTGIGVAIVSVLFFWIALSEGAPALVSTIIGIIFIGGFIGYLRVIAPTPFTLAVNDEGITRQDRGAEPTTILWQNVAKVKEEHFKNGTSVSVTVYKRVGERGLHRAWVVYRDDIPRFDAFRETLQRHLPASAPWLREKVHG